ncbi:MAG: LysR family transcriptional regulator [Blautia sp.]
MSVNFEYYKIFYYVAKYKSITQAASLLYSSQPSISRMIKIPEQELGCTLLIRTSEGCGPDSGGRRAF